MGTVRNLGISHGDHGEHKGHGESGINLFLCFLFLLSVLSAGPVWNPSYSFPQECPMPWKTFFGISVVPVLIPMSTRAAASGTNNSLHSNLTDQSAACYFLLDDTIGQEHGRASRLRRRRKGTGPGRLRRSLLAPPLFLPLLLFLFL